MRTYRAATFLCLLSAFCVCFAIWGCTAGQQAVVAHDAQVIHDATTQPAVIVTAGALNPVTGGISGTSLAIISVISIAVAGYFGGKGYAARPRSNTPPDLADAPPAIQTLQQIANAKNN